MIKFDQSFIDASQRMRRELSINRDTAPSLPKYKRMSHIISEIVSSQLESKKQNKSFWKSSSIKKRLSSQTRKNQRKNIYQAASKIFEIRNLNSRNSPYCNDFELPVARAKLNTRSTKSKERREITTDLKSQNSIRSLSTASTEKSLVLNKIRNRNLHSRKLGRQTIQLSNVSSSPKVKITVNLSEECLKYSTPMQSDECSSPSNESIFGDESQQEYGSQSVYFNDDAQDPIMLPRLECAKKRKTSSKTLFR